MEQVSVCVCLFVIITVVLIIHVTRCVIWTNHNDTGCVLATGGVVIDYNATNLCTSLMLKSSLEVLMSLLKVV